jgi:hypothetical protein
LQLFYLVFHV